MKLVDFKVQLERDVDAKVREWADIEGRSKTRQVAIVLRRLAALRETQPGELQRLGLIDPKGAQN